MFKGLHPALPLKPTLPVNPPPNPSLLPQATKNPAKSSMCSIIGMFLSFPHKTAELDSQGPGLGGGGVWKGGVVIKAKGKDRQ